MGTGPRPPWVRMSSDLLYLSLDDMLTLTVDLGVGPVRDIGLLDSAAHRPQSEYFGTDSYPTVALKAAALLHSLVKNHALIDGCLLYTSPSPRDGLLSRMPSSA